MYANSVAVDPRDGTIDVAGVAKGTVDFDPGATDLQVPIGNNSAAYVIKLTSSGSLVANPIRFFAGTGDAYAQSVALDATHSYVYLAGYYQGTDQYVAFGAPTFTSPDGGRDNTPFVLKLDENLNYVWGATSGLDALPFGELRRPGRLDLYRWARQPAVGSARQQQHVCRKTLIFGLDHESGGIWQSRRHEHSGNRLGDCHRQCGIRLCRRLL